MNPHADIIPNVATTLIDTLIASNRGDRHAFTYNDKRYSYQDVAALMNRAGNLVKALGVEQGAPVLLLLPPSPALVASVLGVIKAGAAAILGAPVDSAGLERCVAATRPAAAIVHEHHLADVEAALATIPQDAILVVGTTAAHRYKSFLQELRGQSSWLAAQEVVNDAPALRLWTGSGVDDVSHAELGAFIDGGGRLGGGSGAASGRETVAIGAMLRAFAKGAEATLS